MAKLDISIAGEINLDLILYGLPQTMPTERELLASSFSMTLGSSSAILAHNLAVLGTKVGFITKVGDDALGGIALDRLAESGVDCSRVVRAQGSGSGVTVILPHERERHILTYLGTICELRFEDLDLEYLASARHFHMSSMFLHRAMWERIPELFRVMKSKGLSTSLDTNDDPDDLWQGPLHATLAFVDVLLPNEREAKKIANVSTLEDAISQLAEQVPLLVVKLGDRGAIAIKNRERVTSPAVRVDVVDPVGAGDSFDAGFLHQYLRGADLAACLACGSLAGAFSTTQPGGTEAFRDRARQQRFFAGAPEMAR
jgi:sugar/nucleoside kinase (ribokinase family)